MERYAVTVRLVVDLEGAARAEESLGASIRSVGEVEGRIGVRSDTHAAGTKMVRARATIRATGDAHVVRDSIVNAVRFKVAGLADHPDVRVVPAPLAQ